MKKIILSLILVASVVASFAQSGSVSYSGVFTRVNDSTAYQTAASAKHSAGYSDIYFNNQATTPHFDIWNGSDYTHVFDFNGGSGSTAFADLTGSPYDNTALSDELVLKLYKSVYDAHSWKNFCTVATTANGTLSTAFEQGDVIDGVTLVNTMRILIKNQSTASQNGIYSVNVSGAPTRVDDYITGGIGDGAVVYISQGTVNQGRAFKMTSPNVTIGTTAQVWAALGDVAGPSSSTDNLVATWDGTTGKLLKNTTTPNISAATGVQLALTAATTTGTGTSSGLSVAANSLTTGTAVDISSTSTARSGFNSALLNVSSSGTVTAGLVTGGKFSVTNTNASASNAALSSSVSGADLNYGIISSASGTGASSNYGGSFTATGSGATNNYGGYFSATGAGTNSIGGFFDASGGTNNTAIQIAGGDVKLNTNAGTTGQVFTSNGPNALPSWTTVSSGSSALSSITAATGTNTINNAANAQEWQWNSLSSGTGLLLSSSSTAAASNTNKLFRVNQTGANATASQVTYAASFNNTKTGTGSFNVAMEVEASGGAAGNYAMYVRGGHINMPDGQAIGWADGFENKGISMTSNVLRLSAFNALTFYNWDGAAYSERMRLTATDGNLVIGTTTAGARLHSRGSGTGTDLIYLGENNSAVERFAVESNGEIRFSGSGGTSGQVLASGGPDAPPTWTSPTGVTLTAVNHSIPKSDGTNLVESGLSSSTAGDINLGLTGTSGATRTIEAIGSASNIGLLLKSKGTASIEMRSGSGGDIFINPSVGVTYLGSGTNATATQTIQASSSATDANLQLKAQGVGSTSVGYGTTGSFKINGLIDRVLLSGTSLTLNDDDHRGKVIYCTSSSAVTITVPSGLPLGFNCVIVQDHATGTVTLATSGTTVKGKTATTGDGDSISLLYYKSSEAYIGF